MASLQLLQLQDGADIKDENIAIAKEQKIKHVAKKGTKGLKALAQGLSTTERESDRDRFTWLNGCMDTADQVIMLYEQDAKKLISGIKKREKLLRGVLQITDLTSQFYLFEYLELACMLLDDPENHFADEFNRVKKYHEEVKKQRNIISGLVDEANAILGEMLESEEIDKVKEKQFDNAVRKAHLGIDSCRSRLAVAEEIIVKINTILSSKRWVSRSFRAAGCLVSACFLYQKYRESAISFPIIVASSVLAAGMVCLSLFSEKAYEFHKVLSNAVLDHCELRRELNDLWAEIENLRSQ